MVGYRNDVFEGLIKFLSRQEGLLTYSVDDLLGCCLDGWMERFHLNLLHVKIKVGECIGCMPKTSVAWERKSNSVLYLICSLGVHYVFDTTIAADFSLLESQKEFVQRYRQQNQEEHVLPMFSSACPGEKSKSRRAVIYFSNVCCNGR